MEAEFTHWGISQAQYSREIAFYRVPLNAGRAESNGIFMDEEAVKF